MDGQQTSPNMPSPAERPVGLNTEVAHGPVPAPGEVFSPGPSATPPPTAPVQTAKLSAADVAAAIAATPTAGTSAAAGAPAVAGDVDLIEPEWVEKAESVVMQHLGDPYGEEEAIEELQVDYLQKRYGIHVSEPGGSDTKPKGT